MGHKNIDQDVRTTATPTFADINLTSPTIQVDPVDHASNHTDGTDDIQEATNAQKGLATAAQIADLENVVARATAYGTLGTNVALGDAGVGGTHGGTQNVSIGRAAGAALDDGSSNNIAIGVNAMRLGVTIEQNIAMGQEALENATAITNAIAIGRFALQGLTTAAPQGAIALGYDAGGSATTTMGNYCTLIGWQAGLAGPGADTIAIGRGAMSASTSGLYNVAIGQNAGLNITGSQNIAIGQAALDAAATDYNVAIGINALTAYTSEGSIALGRNAGVSIATGIDNVIIGALAARYQSGTANALTDLSYGIAIGHDVSPTEGSTNEIVIGQDADGKGSNTVTIGNSAVTENYLTGALLVDKASLDGSEKLSLGGDAVIDGDITLGNAANRTITIAEVGNTPDRHLTVKATNSSGIGFRAGDLYLEGGDNTNASTGVADVGGSVILKAGVTVAGFGGDIEFQKGDGTQALIIKDGGIGDILLDSVANRSIEMADVGAIHDRDFTIKSTDTTVNGYRAGDLILKGGSNTNGVTGTNVAGNVVLQPGNTTNISQGGSIIFNDGGGNEMAKLNDANELSVQGDVITSPSASITPANNGELVVEATSNTLLTFRYKGSDGTVRTGTLALT
jgi:hypothetical protein